MLECGSRRMPSPKLVWPPLVLLGAAGAGLLYFVDPRVPGTYPPCLFLFFTGCYCPGCGTLRALHRLLHGDLRGALAYNTLTVVTLALLSAVGAYGAARTLGRSSLPRFNVSHRVAWGALVVIVLFWTLRNLPIPPLTVLAP